MKTEHDMAKERYFRALDEAKKDREIIYIDGATVGFNGKLGTVSEVGLGVYFENRKEKHLKRDFGISNNEAEFKALIFGMRLAIEKGIKKVLIFTDSKIIKNRVAHGNRPYGEYENKRMDAFQDEVNELKKNFDKFDCFWTPRENNEIANELSHIATSSEYDNELDEAIEFEVDRLMEQEGYK